MDAGKTRAAIIDLGAYRAGHTCPFCVSPLAAPTGVCPACGRDTTATRRLCRRCRSACPSAERLCWNCGARLEGAGLWALALAVLLSVLSLALLVASFTLR